MHSYLRAIGFCDIKKKKDVDALLEEVIQHPTCSTTASDEEGNEIVELAKQYGDSMGIAVRGEYAEDGTFYVDYYFPYFKGEGISTQEIIEVEKRIETDSYAGICDDVRMGVTLIYFLQNVMDYLTHRRFTKSNRVSATSTIAGLSLEGKVLLPIKKNEHQQACSEQNNEKHLHLIAAARDGDEEAMESLTLEDIDTYSMLTRRIMKEDVLSIVDSYFMPYGIESDQFSVLGEIMQTKSIENEKTKEEMYKLTLDCNDMVFDVCINKKDLLGEPMVGRRFKGTIWMQGTINFMSRA